MKGLRSQVGRLLPPRVRGWIASRLLDYGWFGDYADWESASRASSGYDSTVIRERVERAALAVKAGQAAYERDSVAFQEPDFQWPLLAGLMWAAAQNGGDLRVLDFGGAFGSTYFQHLPLLRQLKTVRWCVVEQPGFVERGRELFQDDSLRFYHSVDECIGAERPRVLLFGSVLQYLPAPYEHLARTLRHDFDVVLVDRTGFTTGQRDRITVQKVPPHIYPASYPSWFFSLERFKRAFAPHCELMAEWECADRSNIRETTFRGFLFARSTAE